MPFYYSLGLSRNAFTLAEVLITLGIIGVVAAMTMPALIQKNHQTIAINQLKRSYAVLSTAVERAKADYGDMVDWGYLGDYAKYNSSDTASKLAARDLPYQFFTKYLKPYMHVVKDSYATLEELGYKEPIKYRDGTTYVPLNTKVHYIEFNDGSSMIPVTIGDATPDEDGNKMVLAYAFQIDINGKKNPNILGKDNFSFELPLAKNAKLSFLNSSYTLYPSTKTVIYTQPSRETLLNDCTSKGNYCGALIHSDGWQIKKDYKW